MALRRATPLTFRAAGLSDTRDGGNVFPGAMAMLQNLVPDPSTPHVFVCRPAAQVLSDFTSFTGATNVTAMQVVNNRVYGMVSSSRFAGKDEPFCYDLATNAFIAFVGVTSANVPTTQSTAGDWTPPKVAAITTGRIVVTHPGFPGTGSAFFGCIDVSSFTASFSCTTNSTTALTSATNMLTSGVQPGHVITKADVPAGTTIVSIASNGLSAVMSAAATGSTASTTTFAGGTAAAPRWAAINTTPNPLPSVPISAAQFNGRAWYAVANSVVFSDSLIPAQVTNASQALILGDGQPVTALVGLPFDSPISGGVIQALVAFKGAAPFYQITGDSSSSTLAANQVNGSVGTLAPNTLAATPLGIAFVATDGLRLLGLNGNVTDPVGDYGKGVSVPFLNPINPSRMCAAFNQNVLRITVQNSVASGQPYQEYWYDFDQKVWSGPHTSTCNLIVPNYGATYGFICTLVSAPSTMFSSSTEPTGAASFYENGTALSWTWKTSLLPDNEQGAMNAVIDTYIAMALGYTQQINVTAFNEDGYSLDTLTVTGKAPQTSYYGFGTYGGGNYNAAPSAGQSSWGSFNWGAAPWGASSSTFKQYRLPWSQPLVFKQMFLQATGLSTSSVAIGNVYAKYQILGYSLQEITL